MNSNNLGTLIPIGGNEDKGLDDQDSRGRDFVDDGILSHVLKESGGSDASILVVPTASSIPEEVGQNYLNAFAKLGAENTKVVDIRSRSSAESQQIMEEFEAADGVMFSGGDQTVITQVMAGTKLHELLVRRYQQDEGFVIAGTSAGAMAMSSEMIAGGSSTESFVKGAVNMQNGLGFLPQLIIDSHFIRRGRFGRLAEAVARFPELIGVGLAEDTGMIIKEDQMEVIGSGMIIVFDPRDLQHNNQKVLSPGTPMSLANLKVHVLANGDRFNIKKKKLKILPIDEAFV